MTKLLVVETSPRGDASISRNMTRRFLTDWRASHPDGTIVERDLAKTDLTFVTGPWLQAYFTPPDQHTPEMADQLRLSDELVQELLACDQLLISTPVYNYNVPASLKAWVDLIVRKGLTLGMDGSGLVTAKKATVLIASGGTYDDASPIKDRNIAQQYLRLILNVIGIPDVSLVEGGAAKNVDLGEVQMTDFIESLAPNIRHAAAA